MWPVNPQQDYPRALLQPEHLYTPSSVCASIGPNVMGVYGWWFREIPPGVSVEGTTALNGLRLLYVGIGPDSPTRSRRLRDRLREHVKDDASHSTLRRALGCLLAEPLGLRFRVVRASKGTRLHYGLGEGEATLSAWMERNAMVSWAEHLAPWDCEGELIRQLVLPLNVDGNGHCPFAVKLHNMRCAMFAEARLAYRAAR